MTPIAAASLVWKSWAFTTTQTGTGIWTPAAGKKIAIVSVEAGCNGTAAAPGDPGRFILWFGASADTTYTPGTDQLVADVSFAASGAGFPGYLYEPQIAPIYCANANFLLRITTDANIVFGGVVYGFEF